MKVHCDFRFNATTQRIVRFSLKGQFWGKMNLGVNNTCTESTVLWDLFSS